MSSAREVEVNQFTRNTATRKSIGCRIIFVWFEFDVSLAQLSGMLDGSDVLAAPILHRHDAQFSAQQQMIEWMCGVD